MEVMIMNEKSEHVLEAQQFSREWLESEFFPLVQKMEEVVEKTKAGQNCDILAGKRMISFFMSQALGPELHSK